MMPVCLESLHLLANPGEGAQYGNDDENICNYASGDDCWVLDCAVSDDVNDLEDKPSILSVSCGCDVIAMVSYAAPDRAHPE